MPNIPNKDRLQKLIDNEFSPGGIQFVNSNLEEVDIDSADHWWVSDWNNGFKSYQGKLPKKKPVTFEYIMERIQKQRDKKSINYVGLFDKLEIPNSINIYPTSYGIGVFSLFMDSKNKLKETVDNISSYLSENNIKYTTEYSEAHWVYRFKISQSKDNINKIKEIIK